MDIRLIYTEAVHVILGTGRPQPNPNAKIKALVAETISNLEWDCGKKVSCLNKLEASAFLGRLSRALDEISSTFEWSIEKRILDLENEKIKDCLSSACIDKAREFLFDIVGCKSNAAQRKAQRVYAI